MKEVLTKLSPNGKIKLIVPRREFVDDLVHIEPIEGAVLVAPQYLDGGRHLAVQLTAVFRYGREDDEILGLRFAKEFCLASLLVDQSPTPEPLTGQLKEIVSQFSSDCFPFRIQWPSDLTADLSLQQPAYSKGEPCGIRYYLDIFAITPGVARISKRSSLQFDVSLKQVPAKTHPLLLRTDSHTATVQRLTQWPCLLFSLGHAQLDVVLEKTLVFSDEPIVVHVTLVNNINRPITKLKAVLVQSCAVSFARGRRQLTVARAECDAAFHVEPGTTRHQTLVIDPAATNREAKNVAVRRPLDPNSKPMLAASTFHNGAEPFGFVVSYAVHVKAVAEVRLPVHLVAQHRL